MDISIPLWLFIPLSIIFVFCLTSVLEPVLRGFTHSNPKPKTRPPLGQAPMSPLVRRNLNEVAKAVRNRKKTLILEGKLYKLERVDSYTGWAVEEDNEADGY